MRRLDRSPLEGKSIGLFRAAIKSEETRDPYERKLLAFLSYIGMDADEFVSEAKGDRAWVENRLLEYVAHHKARVEGEEISSSTLRGYLKPVKLLLEMNDVVSINWRKIARILPPARRYALDRAPTLEELQTILEYSGDDLRFKAMLLVMVCSGIREGAWTTLTVDDVQPVERDGEVVCGRLRVYKGDREEYVALITREAFNMLSEYLDGRRKAGEPVKPDSPLARDDYVFTTNVHQGDVKDAKPLQPVAVRRIFSRAFKRSGFRSGPRRRHEFSVHSLRKYFKTRAEQVMKPINVEVLMGHSVGVSDSYYRPLETDLVDDYLKAVPLLTVREAERMKVGGARDFNEEIKRVEREKTLLQERFEVERRVYDERLARLEDHVSRLISLRESHPRRTRRP